MNTLKAMRERLFQLQTQYNVNLTKSEADKMVAEYCEISPRIIREQERLLRLAVEALEYCKAMATGGATSSHRDCIYGKCLTTLEQLKGTL